MKKLILGIETSCDDTSIALIRETEDKPEVLSHVSYSQEKDLSEWGGVVPELAARNHLDKLRPLFLKAVGTADVSPKDIGLIGVTTHPGLLGPLLTGLNAAKTLSLMYETDIMPVNHLYAHLEAIQLESTVSYPYLGLLVSGGHSLFFIVHSPTEFELLGGTIDDAAGEAFDKGGKILGLGYPAGRIIDDLAKKGNINAYNFPIGLRDSKEPSLSYSGVKTSLRKFVEENTDFSMEDVCASYQHAIVMALNLKLKKAQDKAKEKGYLELPVVVGGGVACNSYLRKTLHENFENVFFVPPKLCTDNGLMIANYAYLTQNEAVKYPSCLELDARGRFIDKRVRKKSS